MQKYSNFSENTVNVLKEANIKDVNEIVLQMSGIEKNDAKKIMQEIHAFQSNECIMECGNMKIYFCVPCGHLCYCENCWNHILNENNSNQHKTCPICRNNVEKVQRIRD